MSLKILLADDSLTAQNMGKKILTEAGYEVIAVSNGAQAIKKIVSDRPDMVVLDVYMPGYTGVELCERMRNTRETAATPVVLSVGKMEAFKPEEGTRVRADGVIIKPFEASELLAMIKKLAQRVPQAPTLRKAAPEEEVAENAVVNEPEPVRAIQVPAEIAATPVAGMELISEEPGNSAPVEFEVERQSEPEPAQSFYGAPMVHADGFSAVFEVEPTSKPAPAPVEIATAEGLQTFEPVHAETPTAVAEAEPAPVAEPGAVVDHDFIAVPDEVSVAASNELVAPADLPPPEASVEREFPPEITPELAGEFAAEPESAVASEMTAAEVPASTEPEPAVQEHGIALPREHSDVMAAPVDAQPPAWHEPPEALHREEPAPAWQAEPSVAAAPVWVAEETALAPDESAISLHEEMQRASAPASVEPEPVVEWQPFQQAAEPVPDPALACYQPEPVAEEPPSPEPAVESVEYAPAPTMPEPVPPVVMEAPVDSARVAAIVEQVLERLKPELIAAVTSHLQKK